MSHLIDISPWWDLLMAKAERRRAEDRARDFEDGRFLGDPLAPDVYGVLAERVVEVHYRLPYSAELWSPEDGSFHGEDWPGVNVKGTPRLVSPHLMRPVAHDDRPWADWYVLVALLMEARLGQVLGRACGERLRAAPATDFGHGPTRHIAAADLTRLPEEVPPWPRSAWSPGHNARSAPVERRGGRFGEGAKVTLSEAEQTPHGPLRGER